MNKKIAILVSALALSSFGAHAQARAQVSAGAVGGQVGVNGQTTGVGGQVGVGGGQVNGQVTPGSQGNTTVTTGGLVSGQVNGQTPNASVNGQTPNASINGQVNGANQGVDANGNASGTAVQGGTFAPNQRPFAPGDDPNRFPRRNQQGNTNQFTSGVTNQSSGVTNQTSGVTNQFQPASDGFSGFGGTNQGGLTPTSRDPRIRRLYATNNAAGGGASPPDVASTPFDRNLATSLHMRLRAQGISASSSGGVNFMVNGGQVTVSGSVPTAADKAQIISIVQSSPGVVGVTDQLTVGTPGNGATTTDPSGASINSAPVPAPAPVPASNP